MDQKDKKWLCDLIERNSPAPKTVEMIKEIHLRFDNLNEKLFGKMNGILHRMESKIEKINGDVRKHEEFINTNKKNIENISDESEFRFKASGALILLSTLLGGGIIWHLLTLK